MEDIKINEIVEDISASVESNNINLTEGEEVKRESNDNVEATQEVDTEVEPKAQELMELQQELMELVKAYNAMKRKEANKYRLSKKENKKKKARRRMAKKSRR